MNNTKIKSSALTLAAILLSVSIFTGCKKTPIQTPEVSSETPDTPQVQETLYLNSLTGENTLKMDEVNNRPVAVMISNYKKSLPHRGVNSADIYIECPVEGGITRIMGLFKNPYTLDNIGPVRSARHYYINMAAGFDSIFTHFGGSPQAYNLLKKKNAIDSVDGITNGGTFYRDEERKNLNGLEHSAFTTGDKLKDTFNKKGFVMSDEKYKETVFNFSDNANPVGNDATHITIPYSNYITPKYTFDESTGLYKREQFDQPHIDETTGEQLSVKNILILYTSIYEIKDDDKGRLEVKTTGSGEGVYISGGKRENITWEREDVNGGISLIDSEGHNLSLNKGKTFIQIFSNAKKSAITYTSNSQQ